jgi:hypothetical protein
MIKEWKGTPHYSYVLLDWYYYIGRVDFVLVNTWLVGSLTTTILVEKDDRTWELDVAGLYSSYPVVITSL